MLDLEKVNFKSVTMVTQWTEILSKINEKQARNFLLPLFLKAGLRKLGV